MTKEIIEIDGINNKPGTEPDKVSIQAPSPVPGN